MVCLKWKERFEVYRLQSIFIVFSIAHSLQVVLSRSCTVFEPCCRSYCSYSWTLIFFQAEDVTPKRLTAMALDITRGLNYLAEMKFVHRYAGGCYSLQ